MIPSGLPGAAQRPQAASAGAQATAPSELATALSACKSALIGIAVFSGMLGVTGFGIFLTPVFYYVIVRLTGSKVVAPVEGHVPAATFTTESIDGDGRPSNLTSHSPSVPRSQEKD